VVLTRIGDRRLLRFAARAAALAALASALALAGCGRKGALDPPPSAAVTQPPAPDENASLGQTTNPMTPGFRRAPPQPVATAAPAATNAPPPADRSFFLDFLIK
jgi:predicted small lipoprotein YifL